MSQLFVIVPAAGHSRRMGEDKLSIELEGRTVLSRLIRALNAAPEVTAVVLVTRRSNQKLIEAAKREKVRVIQPDVDPPEMRDSVRLALEAIAGEWQPQPEDIWGLIPADHPLLTGETWRKILDCWNELQPEILVPTYRNRGGHPTLFRWKLAVEVGDLPADSGLNQLLTVPGRDVRRVEFDAPELVLDLDTPADLKRAEKFLRSNDRSGE